MPLSSKQNIKVVEAMRILEIQYDLTLIRQLDGSQARLIFEVIINTLPIYGSIDGVLSTLTPLTEVTCYHNLISRGNTIIDAIETLIIYYKM